MEWNKKNIPWESRDLSWIPKAHLQVSLSPLSLILSEVHHGLQKEDAVSASPTPYHPEDDKRSAQWRPDIQSHNEPRVRESYNNVPHFLLFWGEKTIEIKIPFDNIFCVDEILGLLSRNTHLQSLLSNWSLLLHP